MRPPATMSDLLSHWLEHRHAQIAAHKRPVTDSGEARSRLAQALHRVLSRASTRLPAKGAEARLFVTWLEGVEGPLAREFALHVLKRRKQFPSIYLPAFVAELVRMRRERIGNPGRGLTLASRWLGAAAVLDIMTTLCAHGELGKRDGDFLLYYVRKNRTEDRERLKASRARLHAALEEATE